MDDLLIQRKAVAEGAVLEEFLAMVGGDDDHRVVEPLQALQEIRELQKIVIGVADLAVVEVGADEALSIVVEDEAVVARELLGVLARRRVWLVRIDVVKVKKNFRSLFRSSQENAWVLICRTSFSYFHRIGIA